MSPRRRHRRPSRSLSSALDRARSSRYHPDAMPVAAKLGPLPDELRPGLDLVFVGINPGIASATHGHHYAGPGNHFWPLLYEAGLVLERLTCDDDARLPDYGIGLTNLVDRPSRGIADLSREEMETGAARLC